MIFIFSPLFALLEEDREKDSVSIKTLKNQLKNQAVVLYVENKLSLWYHQWIWMSFEAPPACLRLSKPPGNCPSIAGLVTLPRVERGEVNETFTLESTWSLPKGSFLPRVEAV